MKWQNRFTKLELNSTDHIPELVVTDLKSWNLISVTGDDKESYLQGQLTCDLATLTPQESTLAAHCDAKGKVFSIFRCFQNKDGYSLFHHSSTIETSLKEIKKYSVFSKVELDISSDIAIGLLGSNADNVIDNLSSTRGNVRTIDGGSAVKIENNRWLLVLNCDAVEAILDSLHSAFFAEEDIWDKFDIEKGIPRIIEATQNTQIPQAFNLQAINGISFSKGCYTGQETVARAKYRGTNKRAMAIVKGHLESTSDLPLELERSVGENWRSVGALFAHYRYADGITIGLIILPNNLDKETTLRLTSQPDTNWQLVNLPYTIEE